MSFTLSRSLVKDILSVRLTSNQLCVIHGPEGHVEAIMLHQVEVFICFNNLECFEVLHFLFLMNGVESRKQVAKKSNPLAAPTVSRGKEKNFSNLVICPPQISHSSPVTPPSNQGVFSGQGGRVGIRYKNTNSPCRLTRAEPET